MNFYPLLQCFNMIWTTNLNPIADDFEIFDKV